MSATGARRVPSIMFVCVHNAGRSQMAAALTRSLAGDRAEVRSAGTAPASEINPQVVAAMDEIGIDLLGTRPKVLTADAVQESDVVVTMGCGDSCPYYPGTCYVDWALDDPAGLSLAEVRPIRDEIRKRVITLLDELGIHPDRPGLSRSDRHGDAAAARNQ